RAAHERIAAAPIDDVAKADAARRDADAQLARSGLRDRPVGELELVGATRLADDDGAHGASLLDLSGSPRSGSLDIVAESMQAGGHDIRDVGRERVGALERGARLVGPVRAQGGDGMELVDLDALLPDAEARGTRLDLGPELGAGGLDEELDHVALHLLGGHEQGLDLTEGPRVGQTRGDVVEDGARAAEVLQPGEDARFEEGDERPRRGAVAAALELHGAPDVLPGVGDVSHEVQELAEVELRDQ